MLKVWKNVFQGRNPIILTLAIVFAILHTTSFAYDSWVLCLIAASIWLFAIPIIVYRLDTKDRRQAEELRSSFPDTV